MMQQRSATTTTMRSTSGRCIMVGSTSRSKRMLPHHRRIPNKIGRDGSGCGHHVLRYYWWYSYYFVVSWWLLLLLLFYVKNNGWNVAVAADDAVLPRGILKGPLEDWLDTLELHIPDQSFHKSWIEISIENLVCSHFQIEHLDSSSTSSSDTELLELRVVGLTAYCQGKYKSNRAGVSGHLTAQLDSAGKHDNNDDDDTAIAWTVQIENEEEDGGQRQRPKEIITRACSSELEISKLHFTGSTSAKIIDWFHDQITKSVNGQLHDLICPKIIEQLVKNKLNGYLQSAMDWLKPYLPPPSSNNNNGTGTTYLVHSTPPVGATTTTGSTRHMLHQQQYGQHKVLEGISDKDDDDDPGPILVVERRVDTDEDATTTTIPTSEDRTNDFKTRSGDKKKGTMKNKKKQKQKNLIIDVKEDWPVVASVLDMLNGFLHKHLNHGFVQTNDTCGAFGSNGIRGILYEFETLIPVPIHIHFPTTAAANDDNAVLEIDLDIHSLHFVADDDDGNNNNNNDHHQEEEDWTKLSILQPTTTTSSNDNTSTTIPSSTFTTRWQVPGNLTIKTNLTVSVHKNNNDDDDDDDNNRRRPWLEETFAIVMQLSDIDTRMDLALEIDRNRFATLTGSALVQAIQTGDLSHLFVQQLESTQLSVLVQVLQLYIVQQQQKHDEFSSSNEENKNHLEFDLDHLANEVVQLILRAYPKLVHDAIYGLVQGPVLDYLNQFLERIITHPKNRTTGPAMVENFLAVDRDDGSTDDDDDVAPRWINFTQVAILEHLNTFLKHPKTLKTINDFLDCSINFLVGDKGLVTAEHWGQLQELELLSPVSEWHLQNALVWENATKTISAPSTLLASIDLATFHLTGILNVSLVLNHFQWQGGSVLHYDSNRFQQMPLLDILTHGQCLLHPMDDLLLYNDPLPLGFLQGFVNATLTIDDETHTLSLESNRHIQRQVLSALNWATNILGDSITAVTETALISGEGICNGEYQKQSENDESSARDMNGNIILLIMSGIFIFAQPAILLMKRSSNASEDDEDENDELTEPLLRYSSQRFMDASIPRAPAADLSALMYHDCIPELARHLLPVLILVTTALLLASNLNVGATVDLLVSYGDDQSLRLPTLFGFSLLNTTKELFLARIYPLFVLVVLFSGIWPYVKLGLMFVSWISPASVMNFDRRGDLLIQLDALSKFSLVDAYVLVVMIVAFRYHLSFAENASLDVYVNPQFGFYGFLAATTVSLVVGHVMVYYHRRSELQRASPSMEKESLLTHAFQMTDGSDRKLSHVFILLLIGTLLLVFSLLGIGITRESFSFEFGGIAGYALRDERRSTYSLISLGASLPGSVESGPAVYILMVAFYFYAVVTPFLALAFLSVLLLVPLRLQKQAQFLSLAEMANAWSAIEVFVLSIVAALLQISAFARFIMGHRCDIVDDILAEYMEHGTCFNVTASVSWSSAYLIAGSILNSFFVSVVLSLLHTAIHERLGGSREGPQFMPAPKAVSLVHRLADSRIFSWVFASGSGSDTDGLNESAGPPVFSEELLLTPWQQQDGFAEEWEEAAERDPSWKEWKEATNVT